MLYDCLHARLGRKPLTELGERLLTAKKHAPIPGTAQRLKKIIDADIQ